MNNRRYRASRGRSAVVGAVIAVGVVFGPATASAQLFTGTFELDTFHPAPGPYSIFSVERPRHMKLGELSAGVMFGLAGPMLRACDSNADSCGPSDDVGAVVKRRIGGTARVAVGFGVLELGAAFPVVFSQVGDFEPDSGNGLASAGVGDLRISAKSSLFPKSSFGVGLVLAVAVPTGASEDFLGGPGVGLEARVLGEIGFWRARLNVDAGFRYRNKTGVLLNVEVGHEVLLGLGAEVDVVENLLTLRGEIHGAIGAAGDTGLEEAPIEALGGVRIQPASFLTLGVAAGAGIGIGYGAPAYRVLVDVAFTRIVDDADGDGIPDHRDDCRDEPEDVDGFEDEDGCPDLDNDADGVPDTEDRCRDEPEDVDGFEDEDGCPDPDNDGDGIPDAGDRCPDEPEDADRFEDEDGCPDLDDDGDGIPDATDKCPREPEDRDGFEDDDGCPDLDNDGDGLADADDKCPDEAEDPDRFEDADGCPDTDNDGDGIVDAEDKCPDEAEVINGFEDEDGCPDEGKSLIAVTRERIEIKEKIHFKLKKATIQKKSFKLLAQVATALRLHKEITLLRIEGHTDARGTLEYNMKLSRDRANAVLTHLVAKHGIDPARLVAEGYGPTRPIGKKHKVNRRVEFVVLEIGGEALTPAEPETGKEGASDAVVAPVPPEETLEGAGDPGAEKKKRKKKGKKKRKGKKEGKATKKGAKKGKKKGAKKTVLPGTKPSP